MCFKPISVQNRGEPFHPTLLLQGGGTGAASKNAALGFLALHIVLAALSKTRQDMMPQNIYVSTSPKRANPSRSERSKGAIVSKHFFPPLPPPSPLPSSSQPLFPQVRLKAPYTSQRIT